MTIPDYQTLMLPLLKRAAAAEIRVPEIRESIADEFSLTSEEREEMLRSGTQRVLDNRIHWAKIYLSKAGLLITPKRGQFTATAEGRSLLAENPVRIDNKLLGRFRSFEYFVRGRVPSATSDAVVDETIDVIESSATPEEQIDAAFNALQSSLRSDLIQRILENSPLFFERVIVDLLVAMGYGGSRNDAATHLGKSGDGGVDGVINEDPLGLDRVYVQAKRYADGNNIGRPEIQAFLGSLVGLGASKGVFVTTSDFTAQAKDFIHRLPQRIVLIDGKQLADLMIQHKVGVRTSRTVEFKRVDEDFFLED